MKNYNIFYDMMHQIRSVNFFEKKQNNGKKLINILKKNYNIYKIYRKIHILKKYFLIKTIDNKKLYL